jgi:hypothetical protein
MNAAAALLNANLPDLNSDPASIVFILWIGTLAIVSSIVLLVR